MYGKWQYTDKSHKFERKMISDFNFYSCGIQNCEPNYTYGPISREYYFIHFITSGKGTFTLNKKSFQLSAGQGFISPAKDLITYKASADDPWNYSWIGFLGTQVDQYVQLLCQQQNPIFELEEPDRHFFHKQIAEIIEMDSNDLSKYLKGNGVLNTLVGHLLENKEIKKFLLWILQLPFKQEDILIYTFMMGFKLMSLLQNWAYILIIFLTYSKRNT